MKNDKTENGKKLEEQDMEKVTGGTDENPDYGMPDDEKRPGRPGPIMK